MRITRRVFQVVAGFGLFSWMGARVATGQAAGPPACEGIVSDAKGSLLQGVAVELIAPGVKRKAYKTKADGKFVFPSPPSGPYLLRFFNPKLGTLALIVCELTPAIPQNVCVTLDLNQSDPKAYFNALTALETILFLWLSERNQEFAQLIRTSYPLGELNGELVQIVKELNQDGQLTEKERATLVAKTEIVKRLIQYNG